jgi:hypothetical protein
MSATSKVILLTDFSSGSTVEFSSNNIVYVSTYSTGAKITWYNSGADLKEFTVVETPAAIAAASDVIVPVTDPISLAVTYINADMIQQVIDYGTGAKVYFNHQGAAISIIPTVETSAAIAALVNAIAV